MVIRWVSHGFGDGGSSAQPHFSPVTFATCLISVPPGTRNRVPGTGGRHMLDPRINGSWWALRLAFGVVPIVAGIDKFTNLLTNWEQYLSPLVTRVLPLDPTTFMRAVGVIEIAAGVLVLSKLTRWGAYIVAGWLVAIALNLLTTGRFLDVAARDLVMAVGAFTLAKLSEVRQEQTEPGTVPARSRRPLGEASTAPR
jgi:uncharacterized membrane protein YphA (DoxX/SURF4 family)